MAKKKVIEIDLLEEFSNDELAEELKSRDYFVIMPENVIDTMKLDRVRDNIESVTLDQLEAFFKNPDKFKEK